MTFLRRWLRVPMPPRTRANAQVDFLAAILYGAFGGLTLPFIPVMGRRLGATPLQVSLLVAAPAIVFLLSFWIVNAVRPVHPVRLVMWPALLGRLLFLFMPLIKTPAPYVALIVLYHGVSSINTLGYAQVMRAVYPDDVRGRIMALVKVGMAAFWVLGSLAGGQLTQMVPFQWVFAAAGILGMASALVFSRVRTPDTIEAPEHINPAVTWRILRTDTAFRPFLLAFFVYGFGGWLISPAVPILLVDDLRATNFQVGLLGEDDRPADGDQYHEGRVRHRHADARGLLLQPQRVGGAAGRNLRWANVSRDRPGLAGGRAPLRAARPGPALCHALQHLRGSPGRHGAVHCRGVDPLHRGAVDLCCRGSGAADRDAAHASRL